MILDKDLWPQNGTDFCILCQEIQRIIHDKLTGTIILSFVLQLVFLLCMLIEDFLGHYNVTGSPTINASSSFELFFHTTLLSFYGGLALYWNKFICKIWCIVDNILSDYYLQRYPCFSNWMLSDEKLVFSWHWFTREVFDKITLFFGFYTNMINLLNENCNMKLNLKYISMIVLNWI